MKIGQNICHWGAFFIAIAIFVLATQYKTHKCSSLFRKVIHYLADFCYICIIVLIVKLILKTITQWLNLHYLFWQPVWAHATAP